MLPQNEASPNPFFSHKKYGYINGQSQSLVFNRPLSWWPTVDLSHRVMLASGLPLYLWILLAVPAGMSWLQCWMRLYWPSSSHWNRLQLAKRSTPLSFFIALVKTLGVKEDWIEIRNGEANGTHNWIALSKNGGETLKYWNRFICRDRQLSAGLHLAEKSWATRSCIDLWSRMDMQRTWCWFWWYP